ncbi:uncharacterized protein N0V89_008164 [Didymosphaeria variabile]|uniref:Uncharacterized protein n=1 Tax=Didymosphaeria variabile TaxID=1932322 RepID=A0A9W8XFQ8_9PLEO|nr:uncharacterized protein N0V89_008164 [Didymosphaeria variabile]KAJ4349548.1 hypothetical protein N0V89_008164 [Didymosphaeria variabile]
MPPILRLHVLTTLPHSLRALSILSFIPAFGLLLACGIVSESVNPAISILPLFFSSLYSAVLLANEKKCGCHAAGLTGTPLHMIGVHAYFVVKEVIGALQAGAHYPSACPQCQHMAFPQISVKFRSEGHEGYDPLLDGEGQPAAAVNAEDAI